MTPVRIVGIVLVIAGALALAYGGFSYTKETHQAKLGPLELSVKQKETVNVPQWAGLGSIALGVVLLVAGGKRK
jgi:multidrug transporter EmrE-like cation transporter